MPIQSDRFSIDIDIITQNNREELELFIQKSIMESAFTSFREDERRRDAGGVPKAHYIFNFNANRTCHPEPHRTIVSAHTQPYYLSSRE